MFAIRPIFLALAMGAGISLTLSSAVNGADSAAPAPAAAQNQDAKAAAAKAPVAAAEPQVPKLSVAEIVDKHVDARGGAQAWKAVQTLQLSGRMEAGRGDNITRARKMALAGKKVGGKATNAELVAANAEADTGKQIELPFTLDLKRPNQTRLEIAFQGKTAVQVFDGQHGWKYRPFLNRTDIEPFTADEANAEASRGDLDGPLIDYQAKGSKVDLEGADLVAGQPAYRLRVTLQNGQAKHVWIDAKTFLDVKVEGSPRRMDGKMRPVYVYQRDFRSVQGVVIPFLLETAVDGYSETHKLSVEKAAVNPVLDETIFSKPNA